MRHRKARLRLGRPAGHREAMLAAIVCGLIRDNRITTTLSKARAARRLAEKMVTLAKRDVPADSDPRHVRQALRRQALSHLRQRDKVLRLFSEVAPRCHARQGGYTRIIKLGRRPSDSSEMVLLEWVDAAPVKTPEPDAKATPTKS